MARRVFFSFHYAPDCWRASQVRNSWVTQERKAAGFFDSAEWEEVKKKQDSEIEKWIDKQLGGTSVTVVLIGSNTAGRKWINYEIKSSHKKGNGLLGIYIHNKENSKGLKSAKGRNPFDDWSITRNGEKMKLSSLYSTYDWVNDDGYNNMGNWIEKAAKNSGR
ncbi:MAG: TIR domain-containing protein [Candidatus Moranbacteria bacterium]|nr:TIR domain-containing protein [Candidatus Moranbacteria bacterium]